jgi:tetratricopeptide (TPR) repeat protein
MPSALRIIVLALLLAGCATPRIVVLSDPLDAREHNDLGVSHESAGDMDLALQAYAEAADEDPSWDQPLINLGNVHAADGRWNEAEDAYRSALRRNPANPEAMNNMASVLASQGKASEALEWSGRALDLAPDEPLFMGTRALALLQAGRRAEGIALLDRVLNVLPAGDPLREAAADLRLHALQAAPGENIDIRP